MFETTSQAYKWLINGKNITRVIMIYIKWIMDLFDGLSKIN